MSRNAGFSVIEAVVALAVFSLILLALGGVVGGVAGGAAYSRARTDLSFHMQEQVERLRNTPYANLASGSATSAPSSGVTYQADWTVTSLVPDRLARVDMRVYRTPAAPGGTERAVRLFIANRNP